ncbi:MAG: hypothetical protein V1895_02095, partial [Parcubacteria group bacterium]
QFGRKLSLMCVLVRDLSTAEKKLYQERRVAQLKPNMQATAGQGAALADLALNLLGGQVVE